MKTKYIFKGLIAIFLLSIALSSCESYNEGLLDGIGNEREFSPIGLKAIIRNKTTVELNWTTKADQNTDHFVVEFSEDSEFKTIYKTLNVTAAELPIQVLLEAETTYSIRVKSVTPGLEDSKWYLTTATTLSEQIMLPVQDADIDAKQVTLRWTPGSSVTQIVLNPGNIIHTITPAEKTAGVATITGLTSETEYNAVLYNGIKKRGDGAFKTGIDIGTGILIKPEDDLNAKINEAAAGSILVLMPGEYNVYKGEIALNKTITLRGLRPEDKPKLFVKFTVNSGVSNLSLIDLDLDGTGMENAAVITVSGANSIYGDFLISGCTIHDYSRALIGANASSSKMTSFTVDNTRVKNVNTNEGADFIDFRTTYVANIVVKNSTFDSCSTKRDFVRVDAVATDKGGFSGTGLTTNTLIENCTLYKVSDQTDSKRILYVRFGNNASTVKNTLIVSTKAIYTNQPLTTMLSFSQNYYYEAPSFIDETITNIKIDPSATTANPQFEDAANGDFTVKNQTMIDNNIGDPRWLK